MAGMVAGRRIGISRHRPDFSVAIFYRDFMAAKNTGRGRGTTRPSPPDAALDGFGPEGASVRHAGR